LSAKEPRIPISPPDDITLSNKKIGMNDINDLELLPNLRWDQDVFEGWDIGEKAANLKVIDFIENRLHDYKDGRNFPSKKNVSRLSPHLHFGEVSPNQVWYTASHPKYMNSTGLDHFLSELGWREFSHSLLYFFPNLPTKSLQTRFETFPWIEDLDLLVRWKEGNTGFPIVDAGMRELWRTGYMHNRVRMIVGSFLVKNLRLHWNNGLDWFWDCLVDADLANNSAGWQWIAGCGADAAPYFRIFNPVLQGEKFDKDGIYTKQFVPELKDLPNKYLHCPWTAPEAVLKAANVCLGKSYPHPIVDLKQSREAALKAFSDMKASN
jgi:deoxyribodipyrimidine photo-lyase